MNDKKISTKLLEMKTSDDWISFYWKKDGFWTAIFNHELATGGNSLEEAIESLYNLWRSKYKK